MNSRLSSKALTHSLRQFFSITAHRTNKIYGKLIGKYECCAGILQRVCVESSKQVTSWNFQNQNKLCATQFSISFIVTLSQLSKNCLISNGNFHFTKLVYTATDFIKGNLMHLRSRAHDSNLLAKKAHPKPNPLLPCIYAHCTYTTHNVHNTHTHIHMCVVCNNRI